MIRAPKLKSVASGRSRAPARQPRARRNPTPGFREDLIEALPGSLANDMRVIFDEMVPYYDAIQGLLRGGDARARLTERQWDLYRESYTQLNRLANYAAGLYDGITMDMDSEDVLKEARAASMNATGDVWRDSLTLPYSSGRALLRNDPGGIAYNWIDAIRGNRDASAGLIFEAMLEMIADTTFETSIGPIQSVWTRVMRDAWEMILLSDRGVTARRDAFRAGKDFRVTEMEDDEKDYDYAKDLWRRNEVWNYFFSTHGRMPFQFEQLNEHLQDAFAAGFMGDNRY